MSLRHKIEIRLAHDHVAQIWCDKATRLPQRFLLLGPLPTNKLRPLLAAGDIAADGTAAVDHGLMSTDLLNELNAALAKGDA